jgi:osmotically-inducible protein OsmY
MTIKKIIGSIAVVFTLFVVSCQPKDSEINVHVTENIQSATPGVNADVKDGVATLNGQVKDEASRRAAEDAAKKTKGVKSVVNNITIELPPAPTVTISVDEALQQGVTDVIKDFPGVTVSVKEGEFIVDGELASEKWKRLKMALDGLNPRKVNTVSLKIK